MKLNEKGFAVTGIIYSMLVLFLTLVLLIVSNLASRKVLFDKQKGEILEKINDTSICNAIEPTEQLLYDTIFHEMTTVFAGVQATDDDPYALGAVYSCNLGDGPRTFYVLKEDEDNVKLIMNENIGEAVTWCAGEENVSCEADGAKSYLASQTRGWERLISTGGTVSLPDAQDIADALEDTEWSNDSNVGSRVKETWLRLNFTKDFFGYWTSTPNNGELEGVSWYMTPHGYLYVCGSSGPEDIMGVGVRPVITIPKSYLSL